MTFRSSAARPQVPARATALALVLALVGAVLVASARQPAQAALVIPTQFIAKQHTELLGRAPTADEWNRWVGHFRDAPACDAASLRVVGTTLATSGGFTSAYPEATALDRATRFTALVRAAFNHDPNDGDWSMFFEPYRSGARTWAQTVEQVYGAVFAQYIAPLACRADPGYGFAYEEPLDVRERVGGGASRTQAQLQAALDAASSGSTVALRPGEVVRVAGGDGEPGLLVPAGVRLTTAGSPGPAGYARMGRLVPADPAQQPCVGRRCDDTALVTLETGARLEHVWVDGGGTSGARRKVANVETSGSTASAPTQVVANRITDPAPDGTGIRARGFSTTGEACAGHVVRGNVVTGYASRHRFNRTAQAEWVEGIAVHCEDGVVEQNQVVDASDAGIMLYGSYNRAAGAARPQLTQVRGNTVASAGVGAHVGIGADPVGECLTDRVPVLGNANAYNSCIELDDERPFVAGIRRATVHDNAVWTGPRTSFDVALLVGGAPLWGDHTAPGRGAAFRDNTQGGIGARVNMGISVLGMTNAQLSGNTTDFRLVNGNPTQTWGRCPQVAVGVGTEELRTLARGSQASERHDGADGCIVGELPAGGLERLRADGARMVGVDSGREVRFWGTGFSTHAHAGDWDAMVAALRDVRRTGTNSVRILVQTEDVLSPDPEGPSQPEKVRGVPNPLALAGLDQFVTLAEQTGLYVDVTGLSIEHTSETGWSRHQDEATRWATHERFWRVVAAELADRNAVAFYDLMNEPQLPAAGEPFASWCTGYFVGFCYPQAVVRELDADSTANAVARDWVGRMTSAIDAADAARPVTVGKIHCGGPFGPQNLGDLIDLEVVHVYPPADDPGTPADEVQQAIDKVNACKQRSTVPLVVEETWVLPPLDQIYDGEAEQDLPGAAAVVEAHKAAYDRFLPRTAGAVAGWFSQNDARPPSEVNPTPVDDPGGRLLQASFAVWHRYTGRFDPLGTGIQP